MGTCARRQLGRAGGHVAKTITKTKGGGDTILSRLAKGGKGGKGGTRSAGWRQHVQRYMDEETGDQVVRLYATDVVRVTQQDIVLDSGGYSSDVTRQCINEALANFTFQVHVIKGTWFVSDGRFRLIRFYDGVVISGAAKEIRANGA